MWKVPRNHNFFVLRRDREHRIHVSDLSGLDCDVASKVGKTYERNCKIIAPRRYSAESEIALLVRHGGKSAYGQLGACHTIAKRPSARNQNSTTADRTKADRIRGLHDSSGRTVIPSNQNRFLSR